MSFSCSVINLTYFTSKDSSLEEMRPRWGIRTDQEVINLRREKKKRDVGRNSSIFWGKQKRQLLNLLKNSSVPPKSGCIGGRLLPKHGDSDPLGQGRNGYQRWWLSHPMWKNMRKSNLKIIETKGKMHIQMVHGSSSHSFAISELALQKKNSSLLIPSPNIPKGHPRFLDYKNSIEPLKLNSFAPWKMWCLEVTFDPFSFHPSDFGPICSGKLTVETSKGVVADRTHQGWWVGCAWNHRIHLFWPLGRAKSWGGAIHPDSFAGIPLELQAVFSLWVL